MPRMSKKRRLEWAFFLNERNRITFNALCRAVPMTASRVLGLSWYSAPLVLLKEMESPPRR